MLENQLSRYGAIAKTVPVGPQGKVFFVAPSSAAWFGDFQHEFPSDKQGISRVSTTLTAALANTVASRGDVILVAPGYSEVISSATSLLLATAGVKIIGLGEGTDRPKLSFTTATSATVPVSAANISIENFVIEAGFADIVAAFTTTTAKNFKLIDCAIQASAANFNFISVVDTSTTNNAADGLTFKRTSWIEPDLATASLVDVDADLDGLTVEDCYINLGVNTSDLPIIAIVATGKDVTNVKIKNNDLIRLNDANPLLITADTGTANTGIIANNRIRHADTAGELLVTTTTNIGLFDNKASAVADLSGYLLPTADA